MSVILIVERDKSWLNFMCLAMHRAGYDTISTHDPAEVLALAIIHQPDAVLVNHDNMGHSGEEVCQQLKAEACTHSIPVFLHTHDPQDDTARTTPITDFIIDQPSAIPELISHIQNHLNIQHANTA